MTTGDAPALGTFVPPADGGPAVRCTRMYAHPVERVWRFVTQPAELARWFPCEAAVELRAGGTVRFGSDPDLPGSAGRVLAVTSYRHLSFTWGEDEIRLDLEPDGTVATRLHLTDTLASADTAARDAAGWDVCLDALTAALDGEEDPGPHHTGPTAAWRARYDAYIAAGVPFGAPVPGLD
ncbi:hypothetical protein SRB5_26970 [Streptomyces sp. RB5]|uniref:Activator of Hsp90 ATPase homologue 1/2-like C-terminal domain-containing protein n=1 Tax=Streptomyces smaragdinus TaxID=2585196 RepID=A0A7K0CGG5_9ACTN|nr:SRPBCC family protein [Streptomyces smaragdinus]MQY12561.1 hypothetical protein [Streptomyces smaragdinus]